MPDWLLLCAGSGIDGLRVRLSVGSLPVRFWLALLLLLLLLLLLGESTTGWSWSKRKAFLIMDALFVEIDVDGGLIWRERWSGFVDMHGLRICKFICFGSVLLKCMMMMEGRDKEKVWWWILGVVERQRGRREKGKVREREREREGEGWNDGILEKRKERDEKERRLMERWM